MWTMRPRTSALTPDLSAKGRRRRHVYGRSLSDPSCKVRAVRASSSGREAPRIGGATDAQGPPRRDEALLDPVRLAGKSVAVKDLQALERLLFEVPRDEYTCGLAHTIALFQSEIAAAIHDEWTREGGFRHAALSAGGDSDVYAEDSEVAGDVMRALAESLSVVASRKLAAPLGKSAEAAKPKRAESWRSGRSLRNVGLNLETLRAVVETPGGFADLLAVHGEAALADNLRDELAAAATMAIGGHLRSAHRDAVAVSRTRR